MGVQRFNEIEIDQPILSRGYLLEEEEIIAFATQWNPEPFHIDREAVRDTPMGKLFASGVHLLSISIKLGNEVQPRPEMVAGLRWDEVIFSKPVFAGDTLRLELRCVEKRRSQSRPENAIVRFRMRLLNQRNEETVSYFVTAMMVCND